MGGKTKKSRKVRSIHMSTKHIGLICASFTAGQAVIGIILAIMGIICVAVDCSAGKISKSFYHVYMDIHTTEIVSRISPPVVFLILIIVYFSINVAWLVASIYLIHYFRKWNDYHMIKKSGKIWMIVTAIVCIFDFLLFIFFLTDLILISLSSDTVNNPSMYDIRDDTDDKTTDDSLNPFLRKKIWESVSKPKKKTKRASKTIFPLIEDDVKLMPNVQVILGVTNTNGKYKGPSGTDSKAEITPLKEVNLNKMLRFRFKRSAYYEGGMRNPYGGRPKREQNSVDVTSAPIICTVVALKFFIPWAANVILLIYFKEKMNNLQQFRKPTLWERVRAYFTKTRQETTNGKKKKKNATNGKEKKKKAAKGKGKKKKATKGKGKKGKAKKGKGNKKKTKENKCKRESCKGTRCKR